jgi:hypothetical protein
LGLFIGLVTGYEFEASRYQSYKQSVIIAQKVSESVTLRKEAEAQQTTKEISDAYQHDISVIRSFYDKRLQHDSSGIKLPKISVTPSGVDEISSDQGLIGRCAETTLMLVDLQDWVRFQQKLDNEK